MEAVACCTRSNDSIVVLKRVNLVRDYDIITVIVTQAGLAFGAANVERID